MYELQIEPFNPTIAVTEDLPRPESNTPEMEPEPNYESSSLNQDVPTISMPEDQMETATNNQEELMLVSNEELTTQLLTINAVSACKNEYVQIYNQGNIVVQLGDWILRDSTTRNRLIIGEYSLPPTQTVKIYTGMAPIDETATVSVDHRPIFNDRGGDSVRLLSPLNELIFEIKYTGCGTLQAIDMMEAMAIADETTVLEMEMAPPVIATQNFNLEVVCIHLQREEYVVIRNADMVSVNLENWYLRDNSRTNRLTLTEYELTVDAEVRIYTRTAPSNVDANTISLRKGEIWNNTGDIARLHEPSGTVISTTSDGCEAPTPPNNVPPDQSAPSNTAPPSNAGATNTVVTQNFNLEVICIHLLEDYVVIRNNEATRMVNLQDWYLVDVQNHKLTLPSYDFDGGAEVRVYTRSAPSGLENTISIGKGKDIWNNDGDTADLYEPSGIVISTTSDECSSPTPPDDSSNNQNPVNPTAETTTIMMQSFNLEVLCINLPEDYVVVHNNEAETVNLLSWYLIDAQDNRPLTLPEYPLTAGSEVRIYTRSAPSGLENTISIGKGKDIWNNDGDMAHLYEPSGMIISMTSNECQPPTPPDDMSATGNPSNNQNPADQTPIMMQNFNLNVVCINLSKEYVVIHNNEAETVNLLSWYLIDEQNNPPLMLPEYPLIAGNEVRIYTGSAPSGLENTISIGSGSSLWNNEGDTAHLYEPSGMIISTTSDECQSSTPPDDQMPPPDDQVPPPDDQMQPTSPPSNIAIHSVSACSPEYITLVNNSPDTVDLMGWSFRDEASNTVRITMSYMLMSNATVRVYTSRPDGYANTDIIGDSNRGFVWNNDEDTVILLSPTGDEVGRQTYKVNCR